MRTLGFTPMFVSDGLVIELVVRDGAIGRKKNLLPDVRGVPIAPLKTEQTGRAVGVIRPGVEQQPI